MVAEVDHPYVFTWKNGPFLGENPKRASLTGRRCRIIASGETYEVLLAALSGTPLQNVVIHRIERPALAELEPETYGFREADMPRNCSCHSLCGEGVLTLGEIVNRLRATYCGANGASSPPGAFAALPTPSASSMPPAGRGSSSSSRCVATAVEAPPALSLVVDGGGWTRPGFR